MSRSYRKPYDTITGKHDPADKRRANRAWRRLINQTLKRTEDPESYIVALRYEAGSNNRWTWRTDGKQRYI